MTNPIITLIIGIFIGSWLGVIIAALALANGGDDDV